MLAHVDYIYGYGPQSRDGYRLTVSWQAFGFGAGEINAVSSRFVVVEHAAGKVYRSDPKLSFRESVPF